MKWLWCKSELVWWYPFMQTCGTGLSSTGNEHRTCEECCATDFCNSGGCQQPGMYIYIQPSDFPNIKKKHACTTLRNYLSDKNHNFGDFKELFELQKSSKMNTNYWLTYIQWTSYSAGLPARDQRGPLCYDCTEQQAADDCNRVTVCGLDYVSLRPLVTSPY